ncbi:unnamed protein product [Onchocerca flexuosa]|uniref:Solute carrier family 13 member 2 n=1 Tax=Onchocerca flexuosa TaxID=387005 RepID=A0A183HMT9_9BILA|nr:unnamed protein product [Onchocerca flexuosa]
MLPLKSQIRYQRPESTSILSVLWNMRTYLVLILTPIILSPILFSFPQSQNEAKCGYCVIIMAIYWVMEVLPLAVTALLPLILYPLLGLMKSDEVAHMYLSVSFIITSSYEETSIMKFHKDASILFIGGLMIAVAVQKCKLHNRVALFVLTIVPPQPCWLYFILHSKFLPFSSYFKT